MNAIALHRVGNWLLTHHLRPLSKFVDGLIFLLFNSIVPSATAIGRHTQLGYGGVGVVIHQRAVIGENVLIGPNVTIGGRSRHVDVPVIGDEVLIGAGARVLGPVTVGAGSVVGANAVVIADVPPKSVVAGVPARVIRSGISVADYGDLPLDIVRRKRKPE